MESRNRHVSAIAHAPSCTSYEGELPTIYRNDRRGADIARSIACALTKIRSATSNARGEYIDAANSGSLQLSYTCMRMRMHEELRALAS